MIKTYGRYVLFIWLLIVLIFIFYSYYCLNAFLVISKKENENKELFLREDFVHLKELAKIGNRSLKLQTCRMYNKSLV